MAAIERALQASWAATWLAHARANPVPAIGLAVAALAVAALLAGSVAAVLAGSSREPLRLALLGGTAACLATALGAVPGIALRAIPQRVEDSMLGFAAGMMLAASSFSLILPGVEAGEKVAGSSTLGGAVVAAGMGLGVLLMLGLDVLTPHEHAEAGPCGPGHERVAARAGRVWLFVAAIALHNLPEGMAIGVGFAQADLGVGVPLATAIAIQDIPEGLAVVMALRSAKLAPLPAAAIGAATGLLEPVGALLGVGLASGLPIAYPLGMGLAAGAMIFVVSHEVIPETHRNGHQTAATIGLMAGFAVMMLLDTGLG